MFWLGITMMAVGFIGVLVGAKIKLQPVALISVLLLLSGLGIYFHDFMGEDDGAMELGKIYNNSITHRAGNILKKVAPGKKVLYIVGPNAENSAFTASAVETFKNAYGSSDVVVAPIEVTSDYEENGMDLISYLQPKHIDDLLAANPDAGVVVSEIGLPSKVNQLKCFALPADKRPVFFLTNFGGASGKKIINLLKTEKVAAVVIGKSGRRDPDFEPSAKRLDEAFDRLYVVVDKKNLSEHEKELKSY